MRKRVKGGIVKVYCDRCQKLICDEIPDGYVSVHGFSAPKVKTKKYADYECLMASEKRGVEAGVYCKECAEALKGA